MREEADQPKWLTARANRRVRYTRWDDHDVPRRDVRGRIAFPYTPGALSDVHNLTAVGVTVWRAGTRRDLDHPHAHWFAGLAVEGVRGPSTGKLQEVERKTIEHRHRQIPALLDLGGVIRRSSAIASPFDPARMRDMSGTKSFIRLPCNRLWSYRR